MTVYKIVNRHPFFNQKTFLSSVTYLGDNINGLNVMRTDNLRQHGQDTVFKDQHKSQVYLGSQTLHDMNWLEEQYNISLIILQ